MAGEGRSPSTPHGVPHHTHPSPGWTTHARTQTPSRTCCTTQPLLHTDPNSKRPHVPAPRYPTTRLKSGPHPRTAPVSPHNFSRCRTPRPAPAFSLCVPLNTPAESPAPHTPSASPPRPASAVPGGAPTPFPQHVPPENDREATPAGHACSQLRWFRKGKLEEMPTSGGERRGEKRAQTAPLPTPREEKPKTGGVTLLGAPDTYTLLFVMLLCLPPPPSRALSLPSPPSWPRSPSRPLAPRQPLSWAGLAPAAAPLRASRGQGAGARRPLRPPPCRSRSLPLAPFLLPHSLPSILNTWDS